MKENYTHTLSAYSVIPMTLLSKRFKNDSLFSKVTYLFTRTRGIVQTNNYFSVIRFHGWFAWLLKVILPGVVMGVAILNGYGQNVSSTWGANGNSAWYTGGNWVGGFYAGIQGTAAANANIATYTNAFTALTIGINMGTASLNLGAISVDNTRVTAINIGNSSAIPGVIRLYGATVNGFANVIVRNYGTGVLTLQGSQNGTMGVVLTNNTDNLINTDATGGVSISSIISGAGPLTKSGIGSGLLILSNAGNTYSGATTINNGFINITNEACFGTNPGSFVANHIILNGGGIQTNTSNVTFNSNRGITLGAGGGTFDVTNPFIISLQNAVAGSGDLTKSGLGTLQLNKAVGNTIPITNNVRINGGTLQISTDQTINDLSLLSGNLTVDSGVTLTINGTFDYSQTGTITLTGTGKIAYGPTGTLKYSGVIAKIATAMEFPALNGPYMVNINNSGGVSLPINRTITGSLVLSLGTFTISAGGSLDLNGALLSVTGGSLAGNPSADLTVRGDSGGTITLPAAITLRNVTVGDTRTLALNGINNLILSGTLTIAGSAVFDNGGESQITNGGAPAIIISGTFITKDGQGFYGIGTSIPSILPTFNPGCTIEYGLSTGNPQVITSTSTLGQAYYNITFSGSGPKTPANAIDVSTDGTVKITGAAVIVDAGSNNIGSAAANTTSFIMDGGRLILGTTGAQPRMDGTYTLTGGIVQFAGASNQTIRSKAYQNIEVTGAGVGNSTGNITLNDLGTFTLRNGGVFTINGNTITGTGEQTATVETGALFRTGNNEGFHGFTATFANNSSLHQNIENVVLQPGSTVEYMRTGAIPDQHISNTLPYENLVISGTGIKTAPPGSLTINGNLSKTGTSTFVNNNGTIIFDNTTSIQNFTNSGSTDFNFYNLTDNSTFGTGLNIVNGAGIVNALTLTNNSKLSLGAEDITLVSTASTTARVAAIPATANIAYSGAGRFVVERFFPATRAWRLVTSPLSNTGSIFNSWQNGGNYLTGKGVLVTGPNPLPAVNGLDPSPLNNPSLKAGNNLAPVLNTKTKNLSGNTGNADNMGYFLFVRGDRNPANTIIPNTNNTTISSRGALQTGNQTFAASNIQNDFSLIGNPYPSPVDFTTLTRSNVEKRFITWDPGINVAGGYVVVDDPDNDGIYSYSVIGPGGQDSLIQSSQAFFIQTTLNGPSSIMFSENDKASKNNLAIFRPMPAGLSNQSLRINLWLPNSGGTSTLGDGTMVEFFSQANAAVDIQDALKFANINETISMQREAHSLAIERRPLIGTDDTLFLQLTRMTQRSYRFEFIPSGLDSSIIAFLEDSYTGMKTPLSVSSNSIQDFNISNEEASKAPGRFRIVLKAGAGGPLPVNYSNIKAWQNGGNIALEWTVENEAGISKYEVEKGMDGVNFEWENTMVATGSYRSSTTYNWLDRNAVAGDNYYRVRSIDRNNNSGYSRIVKVKMGKPATGISIYPNPVKNNIIGVEFRNMPAGAYHAKLTDNLGKTILDEVISHSPGMWRETIRPVCKMVPGVYLLEVIAPGNKISVIKAIVQ